MRRIAPLPQAGCPPLIETTPATRRGCFVFEVGRTVPNTLSGPAPVSLQQRVALSTEDITEKGGKESNAQASAEFRK
jgi:hypothetical protein